jgi:predicted transcriptional regulator
MTGLHPLHLTDLRKSGLSDLTIKEADIKTVPPSDINKKLGFNIPDLISCYEIPYDETFSRFKAFYSDNDKKPKYLQRKGTGNRLYIPQRVKPILSDPTVPFYITEGEKKALKAAQEGLYCIGLSGLWNWSNGNKELISDFDLVTFKGRSIYIVPDNDWLQPDRHGYQKNLKQAVYELADKLKKRGAKVFIVELPQGDTKGLDDYLCKYSVEEFKSLPVSEVKSLSEAIAEATLENMPEILKRLANLKSEIQKGILSKDLAVKLGADYRAVKREVKTYEKIKDITTTDKNITIAHPSFYIDHDFMNLGFRETVIIDNRPEDRNFYIISNKDSFYLHENKILQQKGKTIIFDERDRLLIRHEDRWHRDKILSFIKNPETPEGSYHEIKTALKQHIELPKDAVYGLISAWIIATYFYLIFYAFPFLFIYGKKQSGKSRLLSFLERLCFNAMKIKGVSVASLADSIDGVRGTFLNDQAEALSDNRNIEVLGIIADSYVRGGGNRRIVDISNKKRRVLDFETYSPKAFASTKEIDADIEDRCIEIPMIRAMQEYPEPEAFLPIWQDLRDKLYRLLLTNWHVVQEIYQNTGKGVSQRVRELWRPIEAVLILEKVSDEKIQDIRDFFLESMLETQSELTDYELELFEVLLGMLEEKGEGILTAKEIAENLKRDEGITERGLQTWVGITMRQFKLYDYQAGRRGKSKAYKFTYKHVKDIENRYAPSELGYLGCKVVQSPDNQQSTIDNLKKTGCQEVVKGEEDTTYEQPMKSEVVEHKVLINKEKDNLPTLITYLGDDKNKLKKLESLEVIE